MLTHFFVTGTDARVGKTIVTRALLQALAAQGHCALGYKPIATGSQELAEGIRNKDAVILQNSSSISYPYEKITPLALLDEDIYASDVPDNVFEIMTSGLKFMRQGSDVVVVEGCDGWRTLITPDRFYSDWVRLENIPVILVVGIQEGCVSHALLSAQAINADGLSLAGWVANRINPCMANYASIIEALNKVLPCPLLGEIPYISRPEEKELGHFIDLSAISDFAVYA